MQTATTPIAQTQPYYWSEVRFYRCVLAIPWRRAKRYRELNILIPDAYADGKALFRSDAASVQRHQTAVATHLEAKRSAKHNLL
jgi:hypothetical protein